MTAPIESFFKFLEDKKGKKLTGIDNLKYKLKYAPETLTKQDNEIEGDLNLSDLTFIPKGFNPTVDGSLYLSSLTSIPKEFNPTVGKNLLLSGLTSIPEGFNPKVGGHLYLTSWKSNMTQEELKKRFPNVKGTIYTKK